MRPGTFVLGTLFVVAFFFAFIFGGFILDAFFGSTLGVTLDATSLQIEGIVIEFVASVVVVLASLFLSMKRYGWSFPKLILLGSTSLFALVVFEIVSGMSFPTMMSDFSYVFLVILVTSLAGIVYGVRGVVVNVKGVSGITSVSTVPSSIPPTYTRRLILIWSILIASLGGLVGLFSLDYFPFGMFMEMPPPLLGQPLGYQSVPFCTQVCPPLAANNIFFAAIDFSICFVIAFLAAYWIQRGFLSVTLHAHSRIKRNIVPLVLLVITLLMVSSAASLSVASGASLTEPHWSTPSGETFSLGNITLYSGSATTSTVQGAHIDLSVSNYHWTDQTIIVQFVRLRGGNNGTMIYPTVYQCQSVNSCKQDSTFIVTPYSSLTLPVYLDSSIEKGMQYSYNVSITSNLGESIMDFDNISANYIIPQYPNIKAAMFQPQGQFGHWNVYSSQI